MTMIMKGIATWLLMIPVAIVNAAVRETVFNPAVGELRGHQLSSVSGSAAMFATAFLMLRNDVPRISDTKLWKLGIAWVLGTITFEIGAGHYIFGNSWSKLLADYNLFNGRIWTLVLATLLVAPIVTKKLVMGLNRSKSRKEGNAARLAK